MDYKMTIAGLERHLPLCKVTDDLYIAGFIMFNDVEITEAAARELLKQAPEVDVLITAAPMYDLGKVAIDDAVLRKPGRFNVDDREIMKTHAEKGANIIEKLLSDVKDSYFVSVAKNMALYHHERWDGKGYPEQRSGEDIPMEARIMALADVYDALVSKRCYKERMSFREARDVILASMGKQFDPHLKDSFLECQDQLMDYYCSVDH